MNIARTRSCEPACPRRQVNVETSPRTPDFAPAPWPVERLAAWLLASFFALVLSACGGSDADAGTAPSISAQPAGISVDAGATATFSVAATGSDPLIYQWQRNGTSVNGANAAEYTTPATVAADTGAVFTVVVSNAAGSMTSQPATLTVRPSSGPVGGGPAVATDYVLAGLVDRHANGSTSQHDYVLYLVDPGRPDTTHIVEEFGADQPNVVYADAFEIDSSAKTSLYRGAAQTLYVKSGRLWAIDLVAGVSHVPRQVSSAGVCGLKLFGNGYYFPTDSSAQVVWVEIVDCSDPRTAVKRTFVKSSMTPADAPVTLSPSHADSYFLTLPDKDGRFVGSIAQGNGSLDFYDSSFVKQGVVIGSEGLSLAALGGGVDNSSADQTAYLNIADTLYRLTWTATTATISASGEAPNLRSAAISDSNALYFAEGLTVSRKYGDNPAVPLATLTGPPIAVLWMTDDRIIAQQSDGTGNPQSLIVTSIDKTGRTAPIVLAASNGSSFGTTADSVVLSAGGPLRLVKADGSGERVLGAGGAVYDPLRRYNSARFAAFWTCDATATAATNCSNGVVEETLLDGTSIRLGQVSHAVDYRNAVFGTPTRLDNSSVRAVGLPELITFYDAGSANTDLYLWRHGQAESLVRLTHNVP